MAKKLTPMMEQYNGFKNQYPGKIILFRMGDFYETFGDDAVKTAKILNITLTTRDKKTDPTPLAGFPYHALDQYLPKIVSAGESAVIVEQIEDPKQAKGIVKRGVVRIVTPGTLDGDLAATEKNQYLLAVSSSKKELGYAFADLSTGELKIGEATKSQDSINSCLNSLDPEEVLVTGREEGFNFQDRIVQLLDEDVDYKKAVKESFNITSGKSLGLRSDLGIESLGMILEYIVDTQREAPSHLQSPKVHSFSESMILDRSTIRSLDLVVNSYTGEKYGSLLETLDMTVTNLGRRMLYSWILNPLKVEEDIHKRQQIVSEFVEDFSLLNDVRTELKSLADISRIAGKIGLDRANPKELYSLAHSMSAVVSVIDQISGLKSSDDNEYLKELVDKRDSLLEIHEMILEVIKDDPPHILGDGGYIRDGYDKEIDELRSVSGGGKKWMDELIEKERSAHGIPSLKIGFNKVFGYYIEVTKVHQDKVPDSYIRKQTLVNSERYITEDLKKQEEMILNANDRLASLEYKIFKELTQKLSSHLEDLYKVGLRVAHLDVLCNFAYIAVQRSYSKPDISGSTTEFHIEDGRHPVIEALSDEDFIHNSLELDRDGKRVAIITGPNMAGKSTYIRQIAIIALMAQLGSYIPAKEVRMPVIDRIFSRVGASDNLSQGRSTFMVEMEEAANILHNATQNSLIILDEVGRGTSTYDGVSIAWSLSDYIVKHIGAFTLFATHYHELVDLVDEHPEQVVNLNVSVEERDGDITFLRKIVLGSTDKSYGIHVAKMAGFPDDVLKGANELLDSILTGKSNRIRSGLKSTQDALEGGQLMLGSYSASTQDTKYDELKSQIDSIDINSMTPLDALNALKDLQESLDE